MGGAIYSALAPAEAETKRVLSPRAQFLRKVDIYADATSI